MTDAELIDLIERVRQGELSAADAVSLLKAAPFRRSDIPFADVDHHRGVRHGITEVVYGESKSVEQIIAIVADLASSGQTVLITRLQPEKIASLRERFPDGQANDISSTYLINAKAEKGSTSGEPFVAVLAAGTSDAFASEEACDVCIAMDTAFEKFYDVGVAGLHRLLDKHTELQSASALVVVAGMEGALPSVVGGLFGKPIFAVPTSVGYGASFGGIAALLAMLNSCAPGVAVMNIDNGFSAGFAACQVVREIKRIAGG
jgi:NCAIR mutase (PurE)-related protein